MPRSLDARTDILPAPQREIWPLLAAASSLSFVLYGGTAVALHLGHRTSVDFDLFNTAPLNKRDIAAILSAGVSLERGLGAFAKMYSKDPGLVLRAIGFFKDGDLPALSKRDQDTLRAARDRIVEIPDVAVRRGSLA